MIRLLPLVLLTFFAGLCKSQTPNNSKDIYIDGIKHLIENSSYLENTNIVLIEYIVGISETLPDTICGKKIVIESDYQIRKNRKRGDSFIRLTLSPIMLDSDVLLVSFTLYAVTKRKKGWIDQGIIDKITLEYIYDCSLLNYRLNKIDKSFGDPSF